MLYDILSQLEVEDSIALILLRSVFAVLTQVRDEEEFDATIELEEEEEEDEEEGAASTVAEEKEEEEETTVLSSSMMRESTGESGTGM